MDSNTYSNSKLPAERPADLPDRQSDGLAGGLQKLAAEDLDQLSDATLAQEVGRLQRLMDSLEGQWLRRVAAVDARGAAGADQDQPCPPT